MYAKIFDKILDSSVWLESTATRIVWITLLLIKDASGFARFNRKTLAEKANVTPEEARAALEYLAGPDPDSTNPDYGGRRIELVQGGANVLNSDSYLKLQSVLTQRELNRLYQERHRALKSKENLTQPDKSFSMSGNTSTSTSSSKSLKGKGRSGNHKGKKRETVFSESAVSVWEVFRAALEEWPEAQARFYFDLFQTKEALTPSKYLYADWIRAAREWHKRAPEEWKAKSKKPLLSIEEGFKQLKGAE